MWRHWLLCNRGSLLSRVVGRLRLHAWLCSFIPPSCFPSSSSPFTGPCYVAQTSFELLILWLQLLGGLRILPSLALSYSLWTELAETFEAHFIMCSVGQIVKFSLKRKTTLYSFLVKDFEFGAQKELRRSVLLGKRFRELINYRKTNNSMVGVLRKDQPAW